MKSRTIAFETLSCNGEQVTIENDLDNEQQTLHFPILGTTAKGKVVIGFYEGCESGSYLLKTGDFMVCFPSDAHKVGMMNTVPGMVKKVVVKIRVEE